MLAFIERIKAGRRDGAAGEEGPGGGVQQALFFFSQRVDLVYARTTLL